MRPVLPVVFCLLLCLTLEAADIGVPLNYPTIQQAIDAAVKGDEIYVAPGTYLENINFQGKAVTLVSVAGPEVTVLDGCKKGPVVIFDSGEGAGSMLRGFTVTNGMSHNGGGILCRKTSPVIYMNIIHSNQSENHGGGIYCHESQAFLKNNVVYHNTAGSPTVPGWGGGIGCYGASPHIIGNTVYDNFAGWAGGGIYCKYELHGQSPAITGNTIYHNVAGKRGGGVYLYDCSFNLMNNDIYENESRYGAGVCYGHYSSVIANNVIRGNKATNFGGGIYCFESSTTITSNTLYKNWAGEGGGGFACSYHSSAEITNTILWHDQAPEGFEIWMGSASGPTPSILNIRHSDVGGGHLAVYVEPGNTLKWGAGMIDANPLFVETNITSKGDFHLRFASPCKDAGDNLAYGRPIKDREGDPRIAYGTIDMGADEFYTHLYYRGQPSPGGHAELRITGLPGTDPLMLAVGSGHRKNPKKLPYGDWYLKLPLIVLIHLGKTPPQGVATLPFDLPPNTPSPYDVPIQAVMGHELTNLCIMPIRF